MKAVSDVVACVVDHGLFLPVALKLAEQYKHVYWWSPWDDAFPKVQSGLIGDGFENMSRVPDIWRIKKKCDLFVFPDVGFSGLQRELASQGFPVWGHHGADELETQRGLFLEQIQELGMLVPKYEVIVGMTALREHLKDKEDKWIKISKWRGDWETLHWRDWDHDESMLDYYAFRFGPSKELIRFYVFDPIETDIEDGLDTFNIRGRFPQTVMHGLECKDRSYLCSVQRMEEIDERVRMVPEKIGPVLAEYGYQGFFSFEVRIKDDQSYFTDPTCRAASPPHQVMTNMMKNMPEVIWQGAQGNLVEPEFEEEFGVQALLKVERGCEEWTALDIPKKIRQQVKPSFACEIGGKLCFPPSPLEHTIGWLVAEGSSLEGAIDDLKEFRDQLPDGVTCDVDSLANLLKEAETAKEEGIVLTEQELPEPSTVL